MSHANLSLAQAWLMTDFCSLQQLALVIVLPSEYLGLKPRFLPWKKKKKKNILASLPAFYMTDIFLYPAYWLLVFLKLFIEV